MREGVTRSIFKFRIVGNFVAVLARFFLIAYLFIALIIFARLYYRFYSFYNFSVYRQNKVSIYNIANDDIMPWR